MSDTQQTCASCASFEKKCKWLLSLSGEETECDWQPSRYRRLLPVVVRKITPADENNQVVSITGGGGYMRQPCVECPWRRENAGSFPAEAFRISANTCVHGSLAKFACHMAGKDTPKTCAGFLLSLDAEDNFGVRIMYIERGELNVEAGAADLYPRYREMAEENGVAEDDPAIANVCGSPNAKGIEY